MSRKIVKIGGYGNTLLELDYDESCIRAHVPGGPAVALTIPAIQAIVETAHLLEIERNMMMCAVIADRILGSTEAVME